MRWRVSRATPFILERANSSRGEGAKSTGLRLPHQNSRRVAWFPKGLGGGSLSDPWSVIEIYTDGTLSATQNPI